MEKKKELKGGGSGGTSPAAAGQAKKTQPQFYLGKGSKGGISKGDKTAKNQLKKPHGKKKKKKRLQPKKKRQFLMLRKNPGTE